MASAHLAIDLGASSGRAILGVLDGTPATISLHELHRFEHHPCPTPAGPVWDLTGIWLNILEGLKAARQWCDENEVPLESIGVDGWGVDWVLVGESGELLGLSHCYRDPQNVEAAEKVLEIAGGREALYRRTGIQHMPINSLYQVFARLQKEPQLLEAASRLLFVPDLFHFWLTGTMANEKTIASTSSMLSVQTGDWDFELMELLGIPKKLLGPLIVPGHTLGNLRDEVASAVGLTESVKVIAPGAHDTASAVASVPVENRDGHWAYLSSGTWSLLGAELKETFVSDEACAAPFTNELGMSGTVRFLKNIAGLWLVQELRRERLELGEEISFQEMVDQAKMVAPYRTLIDPNDARFAAPGNMAAKIRAFARQTGQSEPEMIGESVRCCLDSLALCYRATIEQIESILNVSMEVLHIVGGGVQNQLLNEITCGAIERPVVCGPVEATAVGNLLTQAQGAGRLKDLAAMREVVRQSFQPETLLPEDLAEGLKPSDEVLERYLKVVSE